MKRVLSMLLIILLLFPVQTTYVHADSANTYDMRMNYDREKKALTFDSTANIGKKVKYFTIGFKFYFTSTTIKENGAYKQYFDYIELDPKWNFRTTTNLVDNERTWFYAIPFTDLDDTTSFHRNTIVGNLLKKYEWNEDYKKDIINFFTNRNTVYIDYVFTIVENDNPQGGFDAKRSHSNPYEIGGDWFWGEVYFRLEAISKARSWSGETEKGFVQYYGKFSEFDPQPIPGSYDNTRAVISRDRAVSGPVISDSTHFSIGTAITLLGDQSYFPDQDGATYIKDKYFRWEYKPVGTAHFPTSPLLEGINRNIVVFPTLTAGSYNVRLSTWYTTNDGVARTEQMSTKEITIYVDDADATITPTVDPNRVITQAQIDANETINVNVRGLAELLKFKDPSLITKWTLYIRKDPSGIGDQLQQFDYTTNLGLTQSASKVFTIPANVLKNADSYTQTFAMKAVATLANGQAVTSNLAYCYFTMTKQQVHQPPVAILKAPSSVMAGDAFKLDGSASYDPDGTIAGYDMTISGLTFSSNKSIETVTLPMGKPSYDVTLTVTDNEGLTDTTTKTINVTAPTPAPILNITGKLKENRIVYLDVSHSIGSLGYPIDYSKTTWSIIPVSGSGATNEIYVIDKVSTDPGQVMGNPYSASLMHGKNIVPVLFDSYGSYEVVVTVTNTTGLSGTAARRIDIVRDEKPIVKFASTDVFFRETYIDGIKYGELTIADESYSPDGDFIAKRKIYIIYDSDNNGVFDKTADEVIIVNDSSDMDYITDNKVFTKLVPGVGKYKVFIDAYEGFIP